ncbi:hydantoinase/oxoprolinase family protein [Oceanidesulfovibrio indonesiensis]|uniref:Hydantoinase/oxoprolinase family protein n=1 Tax=Oceanidesulfovibrio indonesiensis TaxID=54767 RepID=A0A7M3MG44_9BACT|nr:hydantoinase/oxoprolinase family protein [Oceanidesulfovibrio indonesiensis]TVM18288.1 hydantoinase/oxoprolinase family protein [Oceanidesulfovibrio indonesiensis]
MYLGIDVGGTHTDAVVVDRRKVRAFSKVVTDHDNLLVSVRAAMEDVLSQVKKDRVERIALSTTLSTNAIVEHKTEEAGVLVSAGPGIDPENYHIGRGYAVIDGSLDHRGFEVKELNRKELQNAAQMFRELGMRVHAAVGKFSVRNPAHEIAMKSAVEADSDHVTMGHRISGMLNFPRRIATAYYNAAVWRLYNKFADAIAQSVDEYGLEASIHVLKADGGTMPLARSRQFPVESILSGPAASVMGIVALCEIHEDALIMDIGGTTTDIAVFAGGAPVLEPRGIEVGSYPTLVRALKTRSIGIGGDSVIKITRTGQVRVGPEREGPSMAQGGEAPTLIDAMNFLKLADFRDRHASARGIERLARLWDMYPDKLARQAVDFAVRSIVDECRDMVDMLNERPVYTIYELLQGRQIEPKKAYVMGGPAAAFQPILKEALDMRVELPPDFQVANAIGAALTRTTAELELFADTEKELLHVPALSIEHPIPRGYSQDAAEDDLRKLMAAYLDELGLPGTREYKDEVEIVESNAFNMVDLFGGAFRNIRVKAQLRPGILD